MKYKVSYLVPTAHGFTTEHSIIVDGRKAANEIAEKCKKVGYSIVSIVRLYKGKEVTVI